MNNSKYRRKTRSKKDDSDSESFIFNSFKANHYGKRTGHYYGRKNKIQHFDGFPRLSDYPSYGDQMIPSKSSISINNNTSHEKQEQQKTQHGLKNCQILKTSQLQSEGKDKKDLSLNLDFSSVKNQISSNRQSDINVYLNIINIMDNKMNQNQSLSNQNIKQQAYKQEKKRKSVRFSDVPPVQYTYVPNSSQKKKKKMILPEQSQQIPDDEKVNPEKRSRDYEQISKPILKRKQIVDSDNESQYRPSKQKVQKKKKKKKQKRVSNTKRQSSKIKTKVIEKVEKQNTDDKNLGKQSSYKTEVGRIPALRLWKKQHYKAKTLKQKEVLQILGLKSNERAMHGQENKQKTKIAVKILMNPQQQLQFDGTSSTQYQKFQIKVIPRGKNSFQMHYKDLIREITVSEEVFQCQCSNPFTLINRNKVLLSFTILLEKEESD